MLMQFLQISNINKFFQQNSSLLREKRSSNFPSLSLFFLPFESLISILTTWFSYFYVKRLSKLWQYLFIGLNETNNFLFVAYYKIEEENKAKTRVIKVKTSENNTNNNYICFLSKNL